MRATELRIGNLVWDDYSGEMIVTQITYSTESVLLRKAWLLPEGRYLCKDIQFIPLTEEWLLKFGLSPKQEITFMTVVHKAFCEHEYSRLKFYSINNGESYIARIKNMDLITIEYVHELQNFYFTLCGEELTIN